ncbi:trehalose-phosphate phosphatase [bacterium BMS3Abin14]|nr:trehalose-phosphate phosphatase [bacterium BMS3Abin14]
MVIKSPPVFVGRTGRFPVLIVNGSVYRKADWEDFAGGAILDRTGRHRVDKLWDDLRAAGHDKRVLMLDYDGTLSPLDVYRRKVFPYEGVREELSAVIESRCCRLVIISGRWTMDLVQLLGIDPLPEIWGCHGMERLFPDGHLTTGDILEEEMRGFVEADEWAGEAGMGAICERKPGCVVLHFAGAAGESDRVFEAARNAWLRIAKRRGLVLNDFYGGIELRPPGHDKGNAVRAVLDEVGIDAVSAYLGDGLSDEDAFKAINGRGLGVLVREEWRATGAQAWIRPPGQLLEFLRKWAQICGDS